MLFHLEEALLSRERHSMKHPLPLQCSLLSLRYKQPSLASRPSILKKKNPKTNPKATKTCLYYKSR